MQILGFQICKKNWKKIHDRYCYLIWICNSPATKYKRCDRRSCVGYSSVHVLLFV